MHLKNSPRKKLASQLAVLLAAFSAATSFAEPATDATIPVLQIRADQVVAKMPPTFYGLMTEEINYSYEGGLYGELIRNRTFKADAIPEIIRPEAYDPAKMYPSKYPTNTAPKFWSSVFGCGGKISLDPTEPLNAALNVSLKLDASAVKKIPRLELPTAVIGEFPCDRTRPIMRPFMRRQKISMAT